MPNSCDSLGLKIFQSMTFYHSKCWKFYAEFKYLTTIAVYITYDELRQTANLAKSDFIADL